MSILAYAVKSDSDVAVLSGHQCRWTGQDFRGPRDRQPARQREILPLAHGGHRPQEPDPEHHRRAAAVERARPLLSGKRSPTQRRGERETRRSRRPTRRSTSPYRSAATATKFDAAALRCASPVLLRQGGCQPHAATVGRTSSFTASSPANSAAIRCSAANSSAPAAQTPSAAISRPSGSATTAPPQRSRSGARISARRSHPTSANGGSTSLSIGAALARRNPLPGEQVAFGIASAGIGTRFTAFDRFNGAFDVAFALLDGAATRSDTPHFISVCRGF